MNNAAVIISVFKYKFIHYPTNISNVVVSILVLIVYVNWKEYYDSGNGNVIRTILFPETLYECC